MTNRLSITKYRGFSIERHDASSFAIRCPHGRYWHDRFQRWPNTLNEAKDTVDQIIETSEVRSKRPPRTRKFIIPSTKLGGAYRISWMPGEYVGCIYRDPDGCGNDLADGDDTPATWASIIEDILEYEKCCEPWDPHSCP
jgi:hypothetical protein